MQFWANSLFAQQWFCGNTFCSLSCTQTNADQTLARCEYEKGDWSTLQCNAVCTGLCLHCIPVGYINAWIYVPQSAIYTLLYFAYTLSLSHLTTLNPQYKAFESYFATNFCDVILQVFVWILHCYVLERIAIQWDAWRCSQVYLYTCTCILVLVYLYVYNAMHRDAAGCTGVQRGSVSVGPARLMILAGEWGRGRRGRFGRERVVVWHNRFSSSHILACTPFCWLKYLSRCGGSPKDSRAIDLCNPMQPD